MEEVIIEAQAMAARLASERMTALDLSALHGSLQRASCLSGRSEWHRKAAAHAEFLSLLADIAADPVMAPLQRGAADYMREVMLGVGRASDGMIVSSRRRLLAHMRARDGEAAELEMESHLRGLLYMWRLSHMGSKATVR